MKKTVSKLAFAYVCVCMVISASVNAGDVVTASSVKNLNGSLASVTPSVLTPTAPENYLEPLSCLGYYGPISPYGPVGILGPVGDNTWNVSYWISAFGDWSDWFDQIDGPLSASGPLGPEGPLSDDAYWIDLPAINDFSKQLQAGGVWTVLGPVGPLGALGPLGPLGPVGAHGYYTDSNGQYLLNNVEMRTVDVPYNDTTRTYELFENYTESYAENKTDNDTSFMVEGNIGFGLAFLPETDTYTFISNSDQYVTVALVGAVQADDFDLTITDANDNLIATSRTFDFTDWVQLKVNTGTVLKAHVKLSSTFHGGFKAYRLFVTGSTEHINITDIQGDHQIDSCLVTRDADACPIVTAPYYISASSVENLNEDLSSVSPAVNTPGNAEQYLGADTLGVNGPIGPYGVLSIHHGGYQTFNLPDLTWNAYYWRDAAYTWPEWYNQVHGTLDENGPLGPNGLLSETGYNTTMPGINDFAKQLQAGGVWTILGPVGPIGPLGALGPLGPEGDHGYKTDVNGSYRKWNDGVSAKTKKYKTPDDSNSTEVRFVSTEIDGMPRYYELYEIYNDDEYVKNKEDNDTSFIVDGNISDYSETDTYRFISNSEQFVTIMVNGHDLGYNFDLTITDLNDNVIAVSNSLDKTDWVQLQVKAGTPLKAKVNITECEQVPGERSCEPPYWITKGYRLSVTGSTKYINTTDITGDHKIFYSTDQ